MRHTSLQLASVFLSGCVAATVFLLSCTDSSTTADASDSDGMNATDYASRVYRVSVQGPAPLPNSPFIEATAACADGDVLLGGGCWAYFKNSGFSGDELDNTAQDYAASINGPDARFGFEGTFSDEIPQAWRCAYKDPAPDGTNVRAHAHAICFRSGE